MSVITYSHKIYIDGTPDMVKLLEALRALILESNALITGDKT